MRTRFGRPVAVVTTPGLHARVPFVDDVARLDARLLNLDPPAGEFLTNDKKNIVVTPFVLWRIEDPLRFLQTLVTRESAEARLADLVASETGAALGAVPFTRLVSATAGEADLAGVVAGIGERVRERAAADYGVKVVDVRLKRIAFPEQNLLSVFGRMRSERERIARRFRSEGEEAALKIRAEAAGRRRGSSPRRTARPRRRREGGGRGRADLREGDEPGPRALQVPPDPPGLREDPRREDDARPPGRLRRPPPPDRGGRARAPRKGPN